MRKKGKRGIVSEYLPWILIAVGLLVLVLAGVFIFKAEGSSLIEKIKNLIKIG